MEKVDLYQYEHALEKMGITYIGGVDEVGRGPLIGPVVTACCVLPKDFKLDGLTDSKKLTEKKREEYYEYIVNHCIAYAVGSSSPERIDEINIYQATKEAMLEAINKVRKQIPLEHVLIDAMPLELDIPHTSIIKGDAKSISIAAASVIAKVTRDRMLIELDKKYPMYGFKSHKGYPTKKHIEAIHEYGLIDGYRKSFGPVSEYLGLEYYELLDEHGKGTGEVIEKKDLPKTSCNIGAVNVCFINDKEEVMVVEKNGYHLPLSLVTAKETKNKTAIRICKDFGVTVTSKDLKKHFAVKDAKDNLTYFKEVYIIRENISRNGVKYISVDELEKFVSSDFISKLKEGVK